MTIQRADYRNLEWSDRERSGFTLMDTSLPFIAYGLFKPGQICFLQIRDFVADAKNIRIPGKLRLRDGLALYHRNGDGSTINGFMLRFRLGEEDTAYARIEALEPKRQYSWDVIQIGAQAANILVGRSPEKGSVQCDDDDYDGWRDPLFNEALDVVQETFKNNSEFDWDLKPLFRLQMAFLLLWASIERYSTLRYGFAKKPEDRIELIGSDPNFERWLKELVKDTRKIQRADEPKNDVKLIADNPKEAIKYYYQVRCNSAHRGKGVSNDHDIVRAALHELLPIFRHLLDNCRAEASN